MKKIYIVILFSISNNIFSYSQINSSDAFIGIKTHLDRNEYSGSNFTVETINIRITPFYEYCILKSILVGSEIYSNLCYTDNGISTFWALDIGLMPFCRYVFTYQKSSIFAHFKYGLIHAGKYDEFDHQLITLLQKPTIGLGYMFKPKYFGVFIDFNHEWNIIQNSFTREDFDKSDFLFEVGIKYSLKSEK